jgi:hypothetical protein
MIESVNLPPLLMAVTGVLSTANTAPAIFKPGFCLSTLGSYGRKNLYMLNRVNWDVLKS